MTAKREGQAGWQLLASQGERSAMMVFWDCDGLRSVDALRATVEGTLEVYIWIPATRFDREGVGSTVSDGEVISNM
jgi:hypothetical protein